MLGLIQRPVPHDREQMARKEEDKSENPSWYRSFITWEILFCRYSRTVHSPVDTLIVHPGQQWVLESCLERQTLGLRQDRVFSKEMNDPWGWMRESRQFYDHRVCPKVSRQKCLQQKRFPALSFACLSKRSTEWELDLRPPTCMSRDGIDHRRCVLWECGWSQTDKE